MYKTLSFTVAGRCVLCWRW